MAAVAAGAPEPGWKTILNLTSRQPPELYERQEDVGNVPHAGALRTTLDTLEASAVLCVQNVPAIVILSVDDYNAAEVARLQTALWNQGLASLLVVVAGDTVRIFSLARVPSRGGDGEFHSKCLVQTLRTAVDALELANLPYSVESGRFWEEHSRYFKPEERVDRVLLDNLTESDRLLLGEGLPKDATQALLLQTMFVAYLEDRGIIDDQYFRDATKTGTSGLGALLEAGDVASLERLFRTLRKHFNGDLFVGPCSFDPADPGPQLQSSHMRILARFRSGREEMHGEGGQYRFWPYDFKYIPVELISAVHDRFLGERGDPSRRARGAYYTPMFLADAVVSHVWNRLSADVKEAGSFMDPACGSGIFLVRLFQRLCEHRRAAGIGSKLPWPDLTNIMSRLRGWDVDGGAVRVAVFSLYVALLEEVVPPDIRELMKRSRLLPELYGKKLGHGDFFAVAPEDSRVDVVLGNPPWSSRRGEAHSALEWCRRQSLPAPGRERAWAFVWKSLGHLRKDGVVALLLPAMGFLHNHARYAVRARKRLIRETRMLTVVNFADMRFQLFDRAVRPAALVVFGPPGGESAAYGFDYLTPKADQNLKSRRLITVNSTDRCRLLSRDVEEDPAVFKKRLWMSEPEARLFNYLSQFRRLDDLVVGFGRLARRKKPTKNRWVVGQGFQPARIKQGEDSTYRPLHSKVVATTPHLPIGRFRPLAEGGVGLRPWRDGTVRRRGFQEGFDGSRVMVPRGVVAGTAGHRLRAAYVEEAVTFQHIIQAIVLPHGAKRHGMLLAGLLNSRLMLWFAFHGTSSFGADRPEVQQAELLRLPFPEPSEVLDEGRSRGAAEKIIAMVDGELRQSAGTRSEFGDFDELDHQTYEFFCLSDEERVLVEDTTRFVIPSVQPHSNHLPELWRPSSASDRRAYARTLVDDLSNWFEGDSGIAAHLVARNDDLAVLRLSLRDAPAAFDYSEDADVSVAATVSNLAERARQALPASFVSVPDFRVFIDRDLFLVKPAAKRFWLRSAALADVSAIALDLQMALGSPHTTGPN